MLDDTKWELCAGSGSPVFRKITESEDLAAHHGLCPECQGAALILPDGTLVDHVNPSFYSHPTRDLMRDPALDSKRQLAQYFIGTFLTAVKQQAVPMDASVREHEHAEIDALLFIQEMAAQMLQERGWK